MPTHIFTSRGRRYQETAIEQMPATADFAGRWSIVIDREEAGKRSCADRWGLYPCVSAALLVLSSSASGALDPRQEQWSEVVMKSLETNLLADGRVIDTKGEFVRYRVTQVKGNWLWLVADCGRRGWCHNRDVIQVDQAIVFFTAAITREPESARAYRMRGLAQLRCT